MSTTTTLFRVLVSRLRVTARNATALRFHFTDGVLHIKVIAENFATIDEFSASVVTPGEPPVDADATLQVTPELTKGRRFIYVRQEDECLKIAFRQNDMK